MMNSALNKTLNARKITYAMSYYRRSENNSRKSRHLWVSSYNNKFSL